MTMTEQLHSQNGKRISDQFKAFNHALECTPVIIIIQATTRACLAILVVVIGGYLLITQTPVPPDALPAAYLILGAYFGVESVAKIVTGIIRK